MSKIHYAILLIIAFLNLTISCNSQQDEIIDFNLKVEGPWEFISQAELKEIGLENHDATVPFIRLGENDYWIYLSEGGKTDGKHSNIVRVRTSISDIDKGTVEDVIVRGIPDANVNQYNGWKAWMMNLYEIDDDEWLAVLHYEDQDEGSTQSFRMGIAYSNDDAKSFAHLGFILRTDLEDSIIKSGVCESMINIAGTGMRWDDEYFYVYFSDMNEPDRSDRHIAVARAPKDLVIDNARQGKITEWFKYFQGEWNEPGLGGHSTSIGKLVDYHTTIMYNTYIKKWILINAKGRSIALRRSEDPLNFQVPDEVIYNIPEGARVAYCSIHPNQEDMTTCGKEFYVYYRYWYKVDGKPVYDTHRLKVSF